MPGLIDIAMIAAELATLFAPTPGASLGTYAVTSIRNAVALLAVLDALAIHEGARHVFEGAVAAFRIAIPSSTVAFTRSGSFTARATATRP